MASTTEGIKAAPKEERIVSADVMKNIMEFAPNDGFRLSSECLGQSYKVVKLIKTTFNGKDGMIVVLENSERKLNVSLNVLKIARVLGKSITFPDKTYNGHKNVVMRSDAEDIWASSEFLHSAQKMSKEDSFIVPEEIFLQGAIVKELNGKPRINPFLYQGFRKVVESYAKHGKFPTWEDFTNELKKSGDARIKDLPTPAEPIPSVGVDLNALTSITYNLVVSDLVTANE